MITNSLKKLLTGLIDYAGLFPPASLPLSDAYKNYARYINESDEWILSKFICPAKQLSSLAGLIKSDEINKKTFSISVLGRSGSNAEEFVKGTAEDVNLIVQFLQQTKNKFLTDAFEVRFPEDLILENNTNAMYEIMNSTTAIIKENIPLSVKIFFELPLKNDWKESVNNFTAALKKHNEYFGQDEKFLKSGLKLRTGGVEASAFPTPEQIAYVINTCYENQVPVKFTAGLHHPVRHYNESVKTKMHGFLNIFGAAVLLYGNDLLEQDLINIISDEDAGNFKFDDNYFRWKEFKSPLQVIENARRNFAISYGSCSFDEPREDLADLKLM
ncbi:MAG: hypothetical protein K1X86_01605 [Ignavibacteria bacterium]|nr:hypothetical protein [Ignavibacteria bacterium]